MVLVPAPVVTVTWTVPATCAGVWTRREVPNVAVVVWIVVPDDVPKCTAVVPTNPVPRILTVRPPDVVPVTGVTDVTVGLWAT